MPCCGSRLKIHGFPSAVNRLPSLVSYAPVQCLFNEAGLEAMELDQVLNNWPQGSTSIFLNIKEILARLAIGKNFVDMIAIMGEEPFFLGGS